MHLLGFFSPAELFRSISFPHPSLQLNFPICILLRRGAKKKKMVSGRQTFASWVQRFPGMSVAYPALDPSALWLRPVLPHGPPFSSTAARSPSSGSTAAGGASEAKEVQTDDTRDSSSPLHLRSAGGSMLSPLGRQGSSSLYMSSSPQGGSFSAIGSDADFRRGFLPVMNRRVDRQIELSFVDEEDEDVEYGICDEAVDSSMMVATDLDRLLDAPPEPVWASPESRWAPSTAASCDGEWVASNDAATNFGVVTVTDVRDMIML
jgi:hypothetical protein